MERIADLTDRLRWPIVIGWIVLVAISLVASRNLSDLLSNRFDLPDTESTAVLETLEAEFGQRGDSTFLLVVEDAGGADAGPGAGAGKQSIFFLEPLSGPPLWPLA